MKVFPHADLFAVIEFLPDSLKGFIQHKPVNTTFIQKLPGAAKRYRSYLPLMPIAIEQHDLSAYDVIVSSSHAVAKGVLTGAHQVHVSYVHTPMRYAWDLQHQYLEEAGLARGPKSVLARWLLHRLRLWDLRTANGVDDFVANSQFVARRIWKTYRREATVIYPPVDVEGFNLHSSKEHFYLTASRMVPYKRVPLIVEAFAGMPERQLVVIGDGPEMERVRKLATKNITLVGFQDFATLKQYMQRARAFVFAAEEDFGITPVEAQACGTPVIAFGRGGAVETIRDLQHPTPTGVFFDAQTPHAIRAAVQEFERNSARISAASCRSNAERFSAERFRSEFRDHLQQVLRSMHAAQSPTAVKS